MAEPPLADEALRAADGLPPLPLRVFIDDKSAWHSTVSKHIEENGLRPLPQTFIAAGDPRRLQPPTWRDVLRAQLNCIGNNTQLGGILLGYLNRKGKAVEKDLLAIDWDDWRSTFLNPNNKHFKATISLRLREDGEDEVMESDDPPSCPPAVYQPFRFLDLPRELRDQIYHFSLVRKRIGIQHVLYNIEHKAGDPHPSTTKPALSQSIDVDFEDSGLEAPQLDFHNQPRTYDYELAPHCMEKRYNETKEPRADTHIFLVNKQVYEEATQMYYGKNTFEFDHCISPPWTSWTPVQFLMDLPKRSLQKVRSIEVHSQQSWEGYEESTHNLLPLNKMHRTLICEELSRHLRLKHLGLVLSREPLGISKPNGQAVWQSHDPDNPDNVRQLAQHQEAVEELLASVIGVQDLKIQFEFDGLLRAGVDMLRYLRIKLLPGSESWGIEGIRARWRHTAGQDYNRYKEGMYWELTSHDHYKGSSLLIKERTAPKDMWWIRRKPAEAENDQMSVPDNDSKDTRDTSEPAATDLDKFSEDTVDSNISIPGDPVDIHSHRGSRDSRASINEWKDGYLKSLT
ncbi:hypothetical protein BU16DRAFT_555309 [Lophium mytilinum]|uniref:Uncharacterized protein n=1 Tax=Lophium mytilinum TaxID=390894 RepID=A0A6A6RFQ0_9PEZI|nr:hypothetical protein BU16DRAFT_555309 [Lophium mytilinum]